MEGPKLTESASEQNRVREAEFFEIADRERRSCFVFNFGDGPRAVIGPVGGEGSEGYECESDDSEGGYDSYTDSDDTVYDTDYYQEDEAPGRIHSYRHI